MSSKAASDVLSQSPGRKEQESVVSIGRLCGHTLKRSQPLEMLVGDYIEADISPVRFRFVFSRSCIINKMPRFVFSFVFPQLRVFNNFPALFSGLFLAIDVVFRCI